MCGTVSGWIIELIWRRYFGLARRWLNPGFLNGPWLPIYGFGTIFLYYLSINILPIYLLIPLFFFSMTLLEFVAGIFFIKVYKIRLWDYRGNRLNIMGIICPFYSFLWTILGLVFYYYIHPILYKYILIILSRYELTFFLGIYVGVLFVDIVISFNLANRIKNVVRNSGQKWHVEYEGFKIELRDRFEKGVKNRTHFMLPFNGESGLLLKNRLLEHKDKIIRPIKTLKNRVKH